MWLWSMTKYTGISFSTSLPASSNVTGIPHSKGRVFFSFLETGLAWWLDLANRMWLFDLMWSVCTRSEPRHQRNPVSCLVNRTGLSCWVMRDMWPCHPHHPVTAATHPSPSASGLQMHEWTQLRAEESSRSQLKLLSTKSWAVRSGCCLQATKLWGGLLHDTRPPILW